MLFNHQRAKIYFSQHIHLNAIAHVLGGFGLAVVLQAYAQGNSFLPAWLGGVMILASAAMHIKAMMS